MSQQTKHFRLRDHLSRAVRLGGLSARTSAGWLASALLDSAGRSEPAARFRRAAAERAAESLGRLKGLAMKAGQMLSFVSDDVPEELRQALSRLQTTSEPRPFLEMAATIERSLGAPATRVFRSIDPEPMASASIGQVHRAVLLDGTEVAVKVQYADASRAVRSDLANVGLTFQSLRLLLPGTDPAALAAELRERITEELDYRAEAQKQAGFASRFADHPFIAVPRVFESHCGVRVLTAEYVEGRRYAEVLGDPEPLRSCYGEILLRFLFSSIFTFGVVNGDPHPGNYLFDRTGARVTFLDFGCVKQLPPALLQAWRGFAGASLSGDRPGVRRYAAELGFLDGSGREAASHAVTLGQLYFPFPSDQPLRFPNLWTDGAMRASAGKSLAAFRHGIHVPKDILFVTRAMAGLYMVLARLGSVANWHRIAREYAFGEPPATPLGQAERAWAERREAAGPHRL